MTARALVEASSFAEAAPKILQAICESLGWEHGALWTVDRDAERPALQRHLDRARPAVSPSSTPSAASVTFAPGVGLPGRVWASGEPAWIPDVVRDPNFPRAQIAAREGLHAAFGFPVVLHGEVLSVMEFFSLEIRTPDDELLSMLSSVGNQIGLFYERRRAQDDLDRFFTLSLDMLCIVGFDGYFKRVNPAWQRVLGYTAAGAAVASVRRVHPSRRSAGHERTKRRRCSTGEELLHFENRYLHKDGTIRWLLWTATPFPSCRSCTPRRTTSPSERPPKKRSLTTRVISKSVTARSKNRPPGWRNWSRSSKRHGDAPKTRRKPRARFSPT